MLFGSFLIGNPRGPTVETFQSISNVKILRSTASESFNGGVARVSRELLQEL
jgi:hypothetical protein